MHADMQKWRLAAETAPEIDFCMFWCTAPGQPPTRIHDVAGTAFIHS